MQRAIIIPADGYVSIDGRGIGGLDLSFLDPKIHAIQWLGGIGEVELVPDANGGGVENIPITDLTLVQPAIDAWQVAAYAEDNPPPLPPTEYAAERSDVLRAECAAHITGGCACDALAVGYTYPTTQTDQQNLNGVITESILYDSDPAWVTQFWCADANGVWDRRIHSHAQIRAVGIAVAQHVRYAQNKLKALTDQLSAIVADTGLSDDEKRAAIDAVIWS